MRNYDEEPQQRQRRKMTAKKRRRILEKRISRISVLVMAVFFALLIIFNVFFPRSTISLIEKRNLNTFPEFTFSSYWSGEYTAAIASWFDDTVPFRDTFKKMGTNILSLSGVKGKDTMTFVATDITAVPVEESKTEESKKTDDTAQSDDASAGTQTTATETASTETAQASAETKKDTAASEADQKDYTAEEAAATNVNGILIINQDGHYRALEMFATDTVEPYINAVNTMKSMVGSSVNVYSMIAPMAAEFYLPSNAKDYCQDQSDWLDQIAAGLSSDVINIDLVSVLQKHTEEEIYLRTDHHWSPLGAYYAARTLAETAGVDFATLDTYESHTMSGYVGTMYSYSQSADLLNDPEDFTYYVPAQGQNCDYYDTRFNFSWNGNFFVQVDTALAYLTFMGSDELVCKVKNTNVHNGRKLMVIKDSYGNATIPFYSSSFEEVYVIDFRYCDFNLVDFVSAMNITDVVFSVCTDSSCGTSCPGMMMTDITSNYDCQIIDTAP